MKYLFQTLIIVITLACVRALSAADEDPVKLSPNNYKVLLKNKQVRVLEVVLKPGDKSPMHHHPDNVIYVIKGGTARFTDEKGKSDMVTLKTGEVMYREDQHHEVENVGKTTIRVLNVELD